MKEVLVAKCITPNREASHYGSAYHTGRKAGGTFKKGSFQSFKGMDATFNNRAAESFGAGSFQNTFKEPIRLGETFGNKKASPRDRSGDKMSNISSKEEEQNLNATSEFFKQTLELNQTASSFNKSFQAYKNGQKHKDENAKKEDIRKSPRKFRFQLNSLFIATGPGPP